MINPTHRLKKFVKYAGNDKPADFHVTEERGWLGSGITDCNGVEIFEGDIVKFEDGETFTITFKEGAFYIGDDLLGDFYILPEVVGHIATENES